MNEIFFIYLENILQIMNKIKVKIEVSLSTPMKVFQFAQGEMNDYF